VACWRPHTHVLTTVPRPPRPRRVAQHHPRYFVYKHCCARSKRRTSAVTPTDADATALLLCAEGAATETGATEAGVKDAGAKDGGVAAGAGAGPGDGARVAAPGVLPPIQRLSTQAGATAKNGAL